MCHRLFFDAFFSTVGKVGSHFQFEDKAANRTGQICKLAQKMEVRPNGLSRRLVAFPNNVLPTTGLVAKYGQRTVRTALTPALA
ncbi:hypothetical protein N219_08615 [Limosilactobacillus fermentum MTCC 8711]|nr:hypothetical protein N219_08615 [Limosilactobacillus fermentum MTCC 8711]